MFRKENELLKHKRTSAVKVPGFISPPYLVFERVQS
jgi:hypothetical protein